MSTTINMRRKGHSLQACREWDGEELEALPEHTDLKVKITRARSVNQNSMYWGNTYFGALFATVLNGCLTNGQRLITCRMRFN